MKPFQNTFGLFVVGGAVLMIALAAGVTPTSASQAASAAWPETPTVCDAAFCGAAVAADDVSRGANATAAASLPDSPITAPSSGFSAAAMAALGVAMMTGRIRRKALWGVRAPWRPLAAQSS